MSSAESDSFTSYFQFGYLSFLLFVWLLWLGLPIQCWIKVVRVGMLVLLQILAGSLSAFFHWVLYLLWVCHKWPSLTSPQITNAGEGVEKRVPSHTAGGNINRVPTMDKSMEVPQKTKYRTMIWPNSPILGHITRQNFWWKRDMHPYVCGSIIHNSQDMETT